MNPPSPKATARQGQILVAVFAAAVIAAGSLQLTRPGYSVDEEFTVFAVRGIQAHGLPVLPSGLLYDRGIAYSYAAWLAGALTGSELPAFRAVSLVSAALSVLLTFFLVRRIANDATAVIAASFIALSVPFWATATSARFYAPFLGTYLLTLYFLTHRHWWIGLVIAAALARLTHELAFTLAVIPVVCWLLGRDERKRWTYAVVSVVAGLVIGQLVLFALHAAVASSGGTMVRRFFLWQVINLFERPGERQFAIPLIVLLAAIIFAPKRAWAITVVALSIAVMILAFSIAQASNAAPLSIAMVSAVIEQGSRYPLDMFWHVVRLTPLTVLTALVFIAYRRGREWPPAQRAAHALWIGWVLWFGVIESGITTNYLLLPISFLLAAIAIDASATALPRVALAALAVIVGVDQWRGNSLESARPTIRVEGIDDIRAGLQPDDRVACTDELGCMMLVGRIDRWLALDDYVRERFVVQKAEGSATGVYTGVPAAFRPADLFGAGPDGTLPDRVLIVDIFKDYPIGSSQSWVPRAIEQDGLAVVPLLETAQMRVLQVSPREQMASLRP